MACADESKVATATTSPVAPVASAPASPPAPPPAPLSAVSPGARAELLRKALAEDPLPGQLSWLELDFKPFVFGGNEFPKVDFKYPDAVRANLGKYTIDTTYYDRSFKASTSPGEPGRYGAIASITFDSGVELKRYYTLFKQPEQLSPNDWWRWASRGGANVPIDLPPELGIKPEVARAYAQNLNVFVRFGFYEDMLSRPYAARLMAGLYESPAERKAADATDDIITRDRRWWIQNKRKMYGLEQQFAAPIRGPGKARTAAIAVKKGKAKEAGMKEGVDKELDKLFTEWVGATKEPFAVALARNGVVFYQKAFGAREGKPITTETKSHIASVQKVMTGLVMTMLFDQGIVKPDDDISRFFPGLRDAGLKAPITIRHLLTHTSGIPSLNLDEAHDLEEVVKIFLPGVTPGEKFEYSETGYSLCGKIIEMVSGMTVPEFFAAHFLKPLGLDRTEVRGAASDAWSTPLDLVKMGQLILNGGAYGDVQMYGEATAREMMPQRLAVREGDVVHGFGLHGYSLFAAAAKSTPTAAARSDLASRDAKAGFGRLVGHGSLSSTTFAVDLDKKLVVVMTRNHAGPDFDQWHAKFAEVLGRNLQP